MLNRLFFIDWFCNFCTLDTFKLCCAGWSLLFPGACRGRSFHLVILLPARTSAFLVLLWGWMWDHPGNLETSWRSWILWTQAETHQCTIAVPNQTTYCRVCCQINDYCISISKSLKASPLLCDMIDQHQWEITPITLIITLFLYGKTPSLRVL